MPLFWHLFRSDAWYKNQELVTKKETWICSKRNEQFHPHNIIVVSFSGGHIGALLHVARELLENFLVFPKTQLKYKFWKVHLDFKVGSHLLLLHYSLFHLDLKYCSHLLQEWLENRWQSGAMLEPIGGEINLKHGYDVCSKRNDNKCKETRTKSV